MIYLSEDEFDVLRALVMGDNATSGLAPEKEARALAILGERGLVVDGAVTDAGLEALEPFRVKNAVIQAAGFSSRFSPISYDLPKGLMEVRGEILVERQIRQLLEVGITDITIVVGHLAHTYEYLADKYGVKIVCNNLYSTYNTISTYYLVREIIGNTYLLYSDHYITENLFYPYEYRSFYCSLFDWDINEWSMVFDEDRNIIDMYQTDEGAERLHGPAYITRATAAEMAPYIEKTFNDPELHDVYWEYVLYDGREHIHMKCAIQPRGIVNEFDRMSDLEEFDPTYIEHTNSTVLDNICDTLNCKRMDIHDCYPVENGATSCKCHFAVNGNEYVYYHPAGYDGSNGDTWKILPYEAE